MSGDIDKREKERENRIIKAKIKYIHIIGLKVEDLIIDHCDDLIGIKLEGGYTIEAESLWDGGACLEIKHVRPGSRRPR